MLYILSHHIPQRFHRDWNYFFFIKGMEWNVKCQASIDLHVYVRIYRNLWEILDIIAQRFNLEAERGESLRRSIKFCGNTKYWGYRWSPTPEGGLNGKTETLKEEEVCRSGDKRWRLKWNFSTSFVRSGSRILIIEPRESLLFAVENHFTSNSKARSCR